MSWHEGNLVNEPMSSFLPSRGGARLNIGLLDFEPLRVAGFQSVCEPLSHVTIVPTTLPQALSDSGLDMVMLGLHDLSWSRSICWHG